MNLRKDISVDHILGLIDQNHLKIIGRLQWIQALVNNIPELSTSQTLPSVTELGQLSFKFQSENPKYILWPQAVKMKHSFPV